MADLRQDLQYTLRRLSRAPGFVIAVVISIGLGIAANSTIFSMVSRFVLRPAPVGDPSSLLTIHTTHDGEQCCNNFSHPIFRDVRERARSFSGVAAYYELLPASISGFGDPERVWGQAATANFFDVSQLRMTLGRGFLPSEENQPIIVLGYRLWQRRFAADPAIVGKTVSLSGHAYTVVGVAPRGFRGLDIILDAQFWVPLGQIEQLGVTIQRDKRDWHWLAVVGRLQPGVNNTQALAELGTLAKDLARAYPATDKGNGFLTSPAGSLPPRERSSFLLFLAALSVVVLLVLCIAGANVANLMLAQASGRQRELAVRLALGANRGQLLRQMLVESVLLAIAGGFFGLLLSLWATSALSTFRLPVPVPLDLSVGIDWRVVLYTMALSIAAGLLFGVVPAWAASRPVLAGALKGEDALARPGRRWTLRNVLVVAQISLSLVLLCATGLFLRSLQSAAGIDVGFRTTGILKMSVDPQVHGYTAPRTVQFLNQLRERVAALPGVSSAVVTDVAPLSMGHRSDGFAAVSHPKSGDSPQAECFMATPGYFETMGIPRLAGRDFAPQDNATSAAPKAAIVNRVFVDRIFGSQNPIGQLVTGGGVQYQIIGVVGNIKSRTLGEDPAPVLFRSLDQTVASDPSFLGYTLLVRTQATDSTSLATAVREQVRALDPNMAIYDTGTMQQHLRNALFLPRLAATLFGVFGVTGLILAAVGLYGVMSYSVSLRTREIGIRIALGSQLSAVQRLIVRQGMMLTLIALAIGLPAAFAVAKFSTSILYGIRPHDPATFTAVPIFLALIALFACWIPARRASRVEPQIALRHE
jgi:predicted permease